MKAMLTFGAVFAFVAGPALAQNGSAQFDTTNRCLICHTTEREGAVLGVHAERGVVCVDCHGGDPRAGDAPLAHRGNFRSGRDKVATVQICGSCHSDPNRMRQYGLQTAELAEFRTSRHGQLLLLHRDANAPTCTDCHNTHVVFPPDDARSSVYPTNIPGTCAHCHTDQALMAKYKISTTQFDEFKRSAHGVGLFEKQNFAAPTCVGCHGAHSALPPAVTEIANVCARCHQTVGQAFDRGPHGPAARRGKLKGCLGCHSNHGTERVAIDSIAAECTRCHPGDTRIRAIGLQIQNGVQKATEDLKAAERAVAQLSIAGYRADDYRFRYQSALTYYEQIALVQHSLRLDDLDDLGRRVRSISVELTNAAEARSEERWEHRLWLAPVWFLGLSALVLGWFTLRSLKKAGPDREP